MSGKSINFDDEKIKKSNFHKSKKPFIIDDIDVNKISISKKELYCKESIIIDYIDVNKILISKKEPYDKKSSFKYFIRYDDLDYFGPLCIKHPQMIGYVKNFDSNKTMSFKVIDKKLLKKVC